MHLAHRAALLALALGGCADPAGDTGTVVETGGPDVLVTTFQVGIQAGALATLTHVDDTLPSTFTVALVDTATWMGWEDVEHMCAVVYTVDDASPAAAWDGDSDGWWLAWDLTPSMRSDVIGTCDALNADYFGDDVATWVDSFAWAFGFSSTLDPEIESGVAEKLGADFDGLADSTIGAWTGTDLGGSFGFEPVNYGVVYAVDEDGTLLTDGDALVYQDMHASDEPQDGYYYASAWYGWPL